MEAKELRIGNYIYSKRSQEEISVGATHVEMDIYSYKPITLTEEWLLNLGFENWGKGKLYSNEYENYDRYVLYNVLDGTSNFEVHYINSTYGGTNDFQYVISCDEDDRINWGVEIEHVHQLQNLYFALTGEELTIKE